MSPAIFFGMQPVELSFQRLVFSPIHFSNQWSFSGTGYDESHFVFFGEGGVAVGAIKMVANACICLDLLTAITID
jgi:membrane-bound inhibitor of C-type lysozyme